MNQINFRKERDFAATLEVASTFIKQNFINIMKPTLIVVSVPMLIGIALIMSFMQNFFESVSNITDPSQIFSQMGSMFFSYFLVMIAFIMAYVIAIGYIKLYVEGYEKITLDDLLPILKSKTLPLILSSFLLVIIMYIGLILCVFPGIYLSIVFAHFYAVSIIEDKGFGAAFNRSFSIIKDNWWSSFGLYIVTYLIAMGIMMVVYIPAYAIMGIEMVNSVDPNDPTALMDSMSNMVYIMPLYYVAGLIISLLFSVVSSLRYYSLVEKKEGTGESELINKL